MPKTITSEMLHAMTPVQRKTLHQNATGLDTPAAHAVLKLLSEENLLEPIKVPSAAAKRRASAKSKADAPVAATATKAIKAVHGRRA